MNSFAERLSEALSKKGISQAELSRRTGIGRNSISDYLKAKYEAKQDNLLLLANALDVNEAWLMGLDVDMDKNTLNSIYNQLNIERQNKVVQYARNQLTEQNNEPDKQPFKLIANSSQSNNSQFNYIVDDEFCDDLSYVAEESQQSYDIDYKNHNTIAAHRVDETATASPEDKAKLHSKLDEMDRKFDEQQKRIKAAEDAKRGGSDE